MLSSTIPPSQKEIMEIKYVNIAEVSEWTKIGVITKSITQRTIKMSSLVYFHLVYLFFGKKLLREFLCEWKSIRKV